MPEDQLSPAPPGVAEDHGESVVPSRRSMLRGAVGVGAAGIAATAIAGFGGQALAAVAKPSARTADHDDHRAADEAGGADQLVVHVRDARTGQIDLYHGTSQVQVHDRDLAARLVRASRSASKQVR